jgi:hypothetical protein
VEELEKIERLKNHQGLDCIKTVEKCDPLQFKIVKMSKIIAKDPLSIGGRPSGTIRDILPKTWEADIRYYNCYIYDKQLLMGMPYNVTNEKLVQVQYDAPSEVQKTIDELFKGEDRDFKKYVDNWVKLFQGPIPNIRRAAIEAIMRDTQEVARLLAEAMSAGQDREAAEVSAASAPSATATAVAEAEPEAPEQAEPIQGVRLVPDALTDPLVVQTSDPTLPQRYAAFYQMLITRDEWSRAELEALARQHGLMLGGAIDARNDWAFEKFGGQLFVDDGARFLVQREYLN